MSSCNTATPLYSKNSHMLTQEPRSTCATSRSCIIAFLFKFFIFGLFLITIALFPSKAPEFVNRTVLDKFWELLHLLFVGIAVSYGLFSCRTVVDANIDCVVDDGSDSQWFESRMDDALSLFEDGQGNSCGSREEKMSYFWDADGFKNESLSSRRSRFQDECRYFPGESVVVVAQGNCCPENLAHKPLGLPVRSLRFTSDSNSSEVGIGIEEEAKGMRNTSGTFFVGENEYFGHMDETCLEDNIDVEFDNIISSIGYNSLGLPVRKLRSSNRSGDNYEVSSGCESSSSRKSYCSNFSTGNRKNLGQKSVVNLEEKLSGCDNRNYTIGSESYRLPVRSLRGTDSPRYSSGSSESGLSLRCSSMSSERSKDCDLSELDLEKVDSSYNLPHSSPVQLQLRSGRWRESKGDDRDFVGPHSHFRPLSVDESQFESFKSQSFGSVASDSSQGSSISFPPTKHSHFSSIMSEVPDLKIKEGRRTQRLPKSSVDSPISSVQANWEDLGGKTSFRRQYTWASRYRTDSFDGKDTPNAANLQMFNNKDTLSNTNVQKIFEHDLQDLNSSQGEDSLGKKKQYMDSSLNPSVTLDEASSDSPSTVEHVNDEEFVKERTCHGSPAVSSSPPQSSDHKVPTSGRTRTRGAKLGKDGHKSFKDNSEDSNEIRKEDTMTKKEHYMDSLSYAKAPSLTRASLPRAKSVRTRRSNRYMAGSSYTRTMSENGTDKIAGKVISEVHDRYPGKSKISTQEVENQIPFVKQTSSSDYEKPKKTPTNIYVLESEDKIESEGPDIRASSEGEGRGRNIGNAGEDYSSEVDKKAGEFIAKFRKQIRLQKMSSIGNSGELQMGGNYF